MNLDNYRVVGGTYYDTRTRDDVIRALERAREEKLRVRLFLGDAVTGRAWTEEHDVLGYIGRSTGKIKVPLLIHSKRSMGGGAVLDHAVVAIITTEGEVLYKHPHFHQGQWVAKDNEVFHNGEIYGRTKSPEAARRLCDFMSGARFSK